MKFTATAFFTVLASIACINAAPVQLEKRGMMGTIAHGVGSGIGISAGFAGMNGIINWFSGDKKQPQQQQPQQQAPTVVYTQPPAPVQSQNRASASSSSASQCTASASQRMQQVTQCENENTGSCAYSEKICAAIPA